MVARSIAQTTIHFGLVQIPVKLYTTAGKTTDGIKLSPLHAKDGGRLQQRHFCTACNEAVDRDDIVRGYEHQKGRFFTVSADELAALDAMASNAIAIEEYVPTAAIDPVLVEKTFYVSPDKGGEQMFRLLWSALVETGLAAVAIHAAQRRQTVVALRPYGELFVLHQLRYAEEVASAGEVPRPNWTEPPGEMLALAKQIVLQTARDALDMRNYRDELQDRIAEALARKVDGQSIDAPPKIETGKVLDFNEALRASLERARPES